MSFTRKRALLACDFCRHRKRRCDGEKPCSNCRDSAAACHYKDLPVERIEVSSTSPAGSEYVVERLGRIEAILEEQSRRLVELAAAQQQFHGQGGYGGGGGGLGGGGGGVAGTGSSSNNGTGVRSAPFQPNLFSLPPSYSYTLQHQHQHHHHQHPPHHQHSPEHQPHPHDHLVSIAPSAAPAVAVGPATADPHLDHSQFLIPADHFTSASSLFALPRVRSMLGTYPKNYFHEIEESLPLPEPLDLLHGAPLARPPLDIAELDSLARNYFAAVHPNYPLFTRGDFARWRALVFEHGPQETPETAICLCVWALGAVVPSADERVPVPDARQQEKDRLGLSFFQPALRLVLGWSVWGFKPTMTICQALLLAASYFAHLGRPLHSWKMVYFASLKFMFLHDKQKRMGGPIGQDSSYLRVFWSCFMIECDRAAELDVPRSGIEPIADSIPLAPSLTQDEHEEMIYFMAETAIRRLLNRVHSSLYSSENSELVTSFFGTSADSGPGGPGGIGAGSGSNNSSSSSSHLSLSKLVRLSSELNRQLEEWYRSIPEQLRPPLGTAPVASDRGKVLRIRFYAGRHIIHRPFVFYAALQQQQAATSRAASASSVGSSPVSPHLSTLSSSAPAAAAAAAAAQQQQQPAPGSAAAAAAAAPEIPIPQVVLDMCEVCLDTCKTYLRNVVGMLDKRSPYLWTFSQSCMACFLVLLACDSIPQLQRCTTELRALQQLVVPKLKMWATPGSSFEAEVRILEMITTRGDGGSRDIDSLRSLAAAAGAGLGVLSQVSLPGSPGR